MYYDGDVLERLVALRYHCQRNFRINQASAIETLKIGIDRYKEAQKKQALIHRQFAALEAFANHKIAEHQNVQKVSDSLQIFSIRSIPFNPCPNEFCIQALIGIKRSDWIRNINAGASNGNTLGNSV